MEITRGVIKDDKPRVMIYSLPGVGKTTLASKFEKPLFIDVEGGSGHLDVARIRPTTLMEFYHVIKSLLADKDASKKFKTVVIDSLDWLVQKIIENIQGIDQFQVGTKEYNEALKNTLARANGGYGAGKQELKSQVRAKLITRLQMLEDAGFGVVLISHAKEAEMLQGDGTTEVQISPKIDPETRDAFMEWVDNMWYLRKDTDGKRYLLLDSNETAIAKNRVGRSGELEITDDLDVYELIKPNTNDDKERE